MVMVMVDLKKNLNQNFFNLQYVQVIRKIQPQVSSWRKDNETTLNTEGLI